MTRLLPFFPLVFAAGLSGCATPPPGIPSGFSWRCGAGEAPAVNDTLYFGTARPGGLVSAAEWAEFLRSEVTPRFPQGFTVWSAAGQWQGPEGQLVSEPSFVLNLLHPDEEQADVAIRGLSKAYKQRFAQEAVLRVRADACMSF